MADQKTKQMVSEVLNELADAIETGKFGERIKVGVTTLGSEHGVEEVVRGAEMAQANNTDLEVVLIGPKVATNLRIYEAHDEKSVHHAMEKLLDNQEIAACVTMHYNFPIGVSTVGRVITPGRGKEMIIATTTGTSATDRVEAMLRNAIYGIITAKAMGNPEPSVGILNVEGARQVERLLTKLSENGYPIKFAKSIRADGGSVMRGNDLLVGAPDIMVTDTLTGNLLIKIFSSFTTGGDYETLGYGYGPGVGEGYDKIINIISRASGAPLIAGAIRYAGQVAKGGLLKIAAAEFAKAKQAGFDALLGETKKTAAPVAAEEVVQPPAKPATAEISGIDILSLEDAVRLLWKNQIFASSGMGCTGPVVLVAPEDLDRAKTLLKQHDYL